LNHGNFKSYLRVRHVALVGTHRNYLIDLNISHSLASFHLKCDIGSK
jgi:hypothetical protein